MSDQKNAQWKYQKVWVLVAWVVIVALFLSGCGGASKPKMFTVGIVNLSTGLDPVGEGFKAGMTELGYIEGQNVTYIYDGAVGAPDKLAPAVQRLLDANVDLILSITQLAAQAAKKATAENGVPIVFVPATDPVKAGIVQSLTRPGGNITGITGGDTDGRRLEWLLKIAPNIKRIYIVYNPDDTAPIGPLASVRNAASKLGVELVLREARSPADIDAAIKAFPDDVDAIFTVPDALMTSRVPDFAKVALEHKLPMVVNIDTQAAIPGVLMHFGWNAVASGKQAARLADQILKGTKPADLPVETAEAFLTINLKTASAVGINIPDEIVRQATTVIR